MRKGRFAGLVRSATTDPQGESRADGFVALLERSGQAWFWQTDALGHLTYVSAALATAVGRSADDLIDHPFDNLLLVEQTKGAPDARPTLGYHLEARLAFHDAIVRANDGTGGWVLSGEPRFDEVGRFIGFDGFGTPLTERREEDAAAARQARFDSLTGLPNRAHIEQLLDEALANSDHRKQSCAVFLIDLDRFKKVNDTLGHPAGDVLLQQVAERLTTILDGDGQAGRLGGDEFQAVFPGIGEEGRLAGIADRLIRGLSEPYLIHGQRVSIGASVGIAISRPGRTYRQALVKEADLALYAAKRAGRGTLRFFEAEMDAEESQRKILESDLRTAVAKGQLKLLYQPIVAVSTETLVGFEALVRWWHPTRGPLVPADFLPIAEASGQIATLGEWIVRTACDEAAAWPAHLRLAINLAAGQLAQGGVSIVTSALAASGLAPGRLDVEICEEVLTKGDPATLDALLALHGLGVHLSLDDFGRGATSLASLSAVPLDRIKLHPDFLRAALPERGRARTVANALMRLAESLDIAVTAEGAETLDDLNLIRALGCADVQGFLFGRPVEQDEAKARAADSKPVDPTESDGQRAPRHSLIRTATLHAGGEDWPVRLRNISGGGAMIECPREMVPDSGVELELEDNVRLRASVRWCHDGRLGLQFAAPFDFARLGKAKREPGQSAMLTPDYLKIEPAKPKLAIRNVSQALNWLAHPQRHGYKQSVNDPPDPLPPRKIIHVDMDAFYASVEQRDDPALRGKPVAVGGGSERGVVAAASYEARVFGVRSAMASITARRRCPDLVFVKPRFEVYRAVSQQIRAIFLDYTPLVEPLSLDEAYLDVTEDLKGIGIATRIAEEIRARIAEETGLTASAGVSYNKFLAKLASDQNKPDGLCVITPSRGLAFAQSLPVRRFHGVGPKTAEKMARLGIVTGADLAERNLVWLERNFGSSGSYYHNLARGICHRSVKPNRERKSIGAEDTFFTDLTEPEAMAAELARIADTIWGRIGDRPITGRTVVLKMKYRDFRIVTRSCSLDRPVRGREEFLEIGLSLLQRLVPVEMPVRLLGLTLSSLGEEEPVIEAELALPL